MKRTEKGKKLSIKREVIRTLTSDELAGAAGGVTGLACPGPTAFGKTCPHCVPLTLK